MSKIFQKNERFIHHTIRLLLVRNTDETYVCMRGGGGGGVCVRGGGGVVRVGGARG